MIEAASVQADQAEGVIRQVDDPSARAGLNQELAEIRAGRHRREFHVVIFGTGSAGKTSLINALLGREAGKTEAVMGTTQQAENHTYSLEGVEGSLFLTDTPGLSEIGEAGSAREQEARELAARADLLIFVLDHDLVRTEFEPLSALVRQGKRSIVLLNKTDRFTEPDSAAILAKLRERLRGLVPPDDIVAGAASPRPMPVRVQQPDGTVETRLEAQPPELAALRSRIARILEREGESLRAGNLLLRAHLAHAKGPGPALARTRSTGRGRRREVPVDHRRNRLRQPVPRARAGRQRRRPASDDLGARRRLRRAALDSHVRMIGGQMVQMLLKLGLVETATSLVAGIFKSTLVGYAAAGAVQAVSMAYLTHVSGEAFSEYFRHGQTWGDGGMQAALVRQFDLTSRAEFLQDFAKQAVQRSRPDSFRLPARLPSSPRPRIEPIEIIAMSKSPSEYPRLFPRARADDRRHRPRPARRTNFVRRDPGALPRASR